MLIYLIGMPGCGKTTLGRGLAKALNLHLIDMDKVIEDREKKSIAEIFSTDGENYFRDIERLVLHEVSQEQNTIISTGGGSPCFFDNIKYMNERGTTVFIDVSANEINRRMKMSGNASKRPLLDGKQEEELLKELQNKLKYRNQFYKQANKILTGDQLQVHDLKKLF